MNRNFACHLSPLYCDLTELPVCRTVGVELRETELMCYCRQQDRLDASLTGPGSECETLCHQDSLLTCGGQGAASVYKVSPGVIQPQPLLDSEKRNTEIVMIDHVRVGLDVMLMFVFLILVLIIVIYILNKQYQQSYTELQ